MPSDFISLLTSDLDLNSPKSLYSKESVYDLLPKELQLQPPSAQTDTAATSQKSGGGGEAGPPPSATLASDTPSPTASTPPSVAMGAPCSGPSTAAASAPASEHLQAPQHLHPPGGGDGSEFGAEGSCGTGGASGAAGEPGAGPPPHQNTPSKRRPVLSISPPPEDLLDDSQMSSQEEAGGGAAGPGGGPDSEHSSSMWADDSASNFSLVSSSSYNDNTEVPRKSRKRTPRQRPGPKPALPEDSMDVFDADSAMAPHFVLSQLGSDKAGPKASSLETVSLVKGGLLSGQYPPKTDGKELKILVQPETQHRARYLTEGSRGSVKDRTQQSFPQIKLDGVNEPVMLQVFVASDTGRVKPHGFYQACKVTGRNTTACKETEIEGTTVIEIPLEPSGDMTLAVDCVGILKLRNADVEARIGVAGSKKKSTRARLAFRVNIPQADGSVLTLQTPSSPILCTQPAGVPEILKKSLHSSSATGGQEVFIIGKNFLKGTKVIFQENISDDTSWKAEAKIDMDLFHQNHLIVAVPPYHNLSITSPTTVGIFIMTNAGRSHDAQTFTYTPESVDSKKLLSIKTEGALKANACLFEGHLKSMASEQAETSGQPPKPQEITPMEVTSNLTQTDVFKQAPAETLVSVQKNLELSPSSLPSVESFPGPMPLQPEDVELPQAPPVFPSLEPLGGMQKQDVSPAPSYPASADTTLPPVPPEVPQQFLRDPQESVSPEAPATAAAAAHGAVVVVALPQMPAPSLPQQPPQQASLYPQEGVAQLERAVMELRAEGGGGSLQRVFEAAVAQQQLNSVLYSPTPSAESLQQHVQENMNSLCLGTAENPLATQQHLEIQQRQRRHQQQQQQQMQFQQQQQQHQQQLQQRQQQQMIGNLQIQQQLLLQPQDQLQQQQIIENMQQQQQVLGNIQLQEQQQQQNQILSNLQQQHQLQQEQQNQALGGLQHQQQNQALNGLQQQQQNQALGSLQPSQALGVLQQHQALNSLQHQHQQTHSLSSLQQHHQQQNQALGALQQQQNQALNVLQQQQQNQALNALQQQQQQQQNQVLSSIQQQQQSQVLSSIQQQQQKQVLNIIQQQQQQNQALSSLQQQQNQALQQQQLQEQQDLEIYKNQFQPQIHCPQPLASSQAPQSVSLLQQAGELLTIQASFPQQQPAAAHTSPPHQLFQSPGPLPESQSPQQQQGQAALLPGALAVLTGVGLSPERHSPGSTLFLSASPQQPPPQQQQQTGLAFLSSMETSASEPQSIGLFPNPQQQSMPMEQQQPQQPQQQAVPGGPQGSLFQVLPGQGAPLPQSLPQSTGQLLCTTDLSPQAIPPALLFSTQSQDAPALGGLGVRVAMPQQQDAAEPMSFQDQSSLGGGGGGSPSSGGARRRGLYQEQQQPMQVAPCPGATGVPGGQPVELFLPQASSISGLQQSSMDTRELRTQATASGATIFVVQGGVGVGVVGAPGQQQQPADHFFQSSVGGNAPAQGQPKVFVFGIQNDPSQLLSPSGPGLAAAQSQPQSLQPLLDAPMAQTASSRQAAMHSGLGGPLQTNLQEQMASAMQTGTQSALQSSLQALETTLPTPMQTGLGTQLQGGLQNSLPAAANMEKIEDLLDSLQKQL